MAMCNQILKYVIYEQMNKNVVKTKQKQKRHSFNNRNWSVLQGTRL